MLRKLLVISIICIIAGILLIPPVVRTYPFAKKASGLIALAIPCQRELSFNPFSVNGYIVRPRLAMWLLMNTEYPYTEQKIYFNKYKHSQPLINLIGAGLDMSCFKDNGGYELLGHVIERGEPIDEYYQGLTPVHSAILFNDPKYLEMLLAAGADPNKKIIKEENRAHNNMNAFQFFDLLNNKNPGDYREIRNVLDKYKK